MDRGKVIVEVWFLVFCKPRQELVAQHNLMNQGFHVYLPRMKTRKLHRGKWVDAVEVLFPRYLFLRVDPQQSNIAVVRSTRGVIGFVRFGGQPVIVKDEVVESLLNREDAELGLRKDDRPLFYAGDQVKMLDGPLAGIDGVFLHEDADTRVVILLDLLGKTNEIKVNRDWVAQVS